MPGVTVVAVDQEIHGETSIIHQSPDSDHLRLRAYRCVEDTTFPRKRFLVAFLKNMEIIFKL